MKNKLSTSLLKRGLAVSMISALLLGATACGTTSTGDTATDDTTEEVVTEETDDATDTADTDTETSAFDWWSGDWYGWWVTKDTTGSWKQYDDASYDVCAQVTVTGDDIEFLIWEENGSTEEPLAIISGKLTEDHSEHGSATSTEGELADMWVEEDDITMDSDAVKDVDDLMVLEGSLKNDDGSFDFEMYLRPWGTDWSDLEAKEDNLPYYYDDFLPVFYTDWYLPLIEAGESMPTEFDLSELLDTTEAE